jgi:NAD(P)H-hydrate epimerase
MKILTAAEQQELDRRTMENEPISSIALMERAAYRYTEKLLPCLSKKITIGVLCGPGNNGGDGLVIARLLSQENFEVNCYYVSLSDKGSDEFEENRSRLKTTSVNWITLDSEKSINEAEWSEPVFIDAIFGTGLSRPAEGLAETVIKKINRLEKRVFAVDVPSGMYCDSPNDEDDAIINAYKTFTFHAPKISFFYPEQGKYCGEFEVVDIGLDAEITSEQKSNLNMITIDQLLDLRKSRSCFSHKGTYGHAGIIAGSHSKMGAALLSSESALKTGVGLVTAYVPESGSVAFNVRIPSVMLNFTGSKECSKINFNENITYGIGPGIGTSNNVKKAMTEFLTLANEPIIIDADALNIIASNKSLMKEVPTESILTPHPKEFERLVGSFKNSYERTEKQTKFSKKHKVYIVLKDTFSVVSTPEGDLFINPFGSSGMATGGSGDVLTGILTGLLAQGYSCLNAAIFGVGLHGLSGEESTKDLGEEAMNSEDLISYISAGFSRLNRID